MAKRKHTADADLAELGPVVDAARDGPAVNPTTADRTRPALNEHPIREGALELALKAIKLCNTARKCHDRADAALDELARARRVAAKANG